MQREGSLPVRRQQQQHAQRTPRVHLDSQDKREGQRNGPRDEKIRMAMEDINVNTLADDRTRETAQLSPPREALRFATKSSQLERRQLLHEQASASADEAVAQSHVEHTLAEIQRFLPLEVIYAFGKGKFASPAQQRAADVLFRVGARLRFNLVVQALLQWKLVVANLVAREQASAALRIQCCWRQVCASRELQARRHVREEFRKRQEALLRMLASKQNKAAVVITRAIRGYAYHRQRERLIRELDAAKTIQKFWRQRQAFWVALRTRLRKKQCHEAAVCIQKHARGRRARRRRHLLQMIRRVDVKRAQRAQQAKERQQLLRVQGAAILVQRAFRKWQQRRVLALRRRRAQFERDKVKIVKVQAQYRAQKARRLFIRHLLKVHSAVLVIQAAWRCCQARRVRSALENARAEQRRQWMKEVEERRRKHKNRVVAVNQQMKKTWNQFVVLKDKMAAGPAGTTAGGPSQREVLAAMQLQARWRGIRIRRRIRHEKARELEMQRRAVNRKRRLAATCIQKRVRGVQGRAKAWECVVQRSASRIQSAWRGFRTRRELLRMRNALEAITKMQIQWRQRRSVEYQRQRTRAASTIQRRTRVLLGRRWLRKMVRRQQVLAEEQAMGSVLLEATRRRVKDELLLQSFVYKDIALADPKQLSAKSHLAGGGAESDDGRTNKSLFRVDLGKAQWTRRGYDGVWQEVFRDASGGAAEIDNSRFARLLKALPHAFVNKTSFPMQTVDLIFAKMKEPKARAISFARFTTAILAVLQEKFSPSTTAAAERSPPKSSASSLPHHSQTKKSAEQTAADHVRFLQFMNQFVLPSTLQSGKYRKTLENHCTQRICWAVAMLRRFANRIAARKFHDRFVVLHRERQERKRRVRCANAIGTCYRRYRFRAQMKTMLASMFVEYVDHHGHAVRFKLASTGKTVTRRPIFLKGVACKKVVPLPFPGEEFHAFCERHEDSSAGAAGTKVPAEVYCVECEDAMCAICFARDHSKRQAFQRHEQRRILACTHCLTETATRECLHCGNGRVPYCDACFPHVHKVMVDKKRHEEPPGRDSVTAAAATNLQTSVLSKPLDAHRFQPLVVMCSECSSRAAQWRCETCADVYCKRCLSGIHAKGQRQHHRCHRLSYFSMLKQHAERERSASAQQELEKRRRAREKERKEQEVRERLRNASATKIQAMARAFVARQHGRAYMKLVRQTQAAKAQRLKDEKIRASISYKVKNVLGISPALKSDTKQETTARQQRIEVIKATLFLHRRVLRGANDEEAGASPFQRKKKRWTKTQKAQVLKAAHSWCVYGARVKILKGEWKQSVGSILSTQNLLATGFVVVFVPLAHRSVVVNWEQLAPFDADDVLRQPYEPPTRVLADAAHDFHARLSGVVASAARKARLLYLQTIEFHDIVSYAWVVDYNKVAQREEFWNVVLNKRTFNAPRAMELIERMEGEQRQEVEARVATAKAKLLDLLHPFQPKNKARLALRRNALAPAVTTPKTRKHTDAAADDDDDAESAERGAADEDHAGALSCARFWHETIVPHDVLGGKKASRFLSACMAPPYSTLACWRMLKLWQWMDLYEADGYEPHAKAFFSLTDDVQLYIADELAQPMDAGNTREARDKLLQLLKLNEETLQLLVFNAAQQRAAADEAAAARAT